jgi:hypothetical protein
VGIGVITLERAISEGRGVERPFTCHAHENNSITASVNIMKGVWFCYSCYAHGWLEDHVPSVDEAISVMNGETNPRIYPEEWLDIFDADHVSPYWVGRIGIDVAAENRCGTDLLTGAPTYPIRDEHSRVVGVVTRHEKIDPKYRYPAGVSTSRTFYGQVNKCEVLILLEGAGDVMALQQAGLPEGWNAVGCYGAGLHYPQIALVASMNPKVVIAAFDDDPAGRAAQARSMDMLDDLVPVLSHLWLTVGGKDAGEVPVEARIPSLEKTLTARNHMKGITDD